MRITDRVERTVIAAIEGHAALAGCEVDHQVQIIHQQTRPGVQPTPMLWILLSVQSLALGEWLVHDPIITPDLHPEPEQLTKVVRQALANLASARGRETKTFAPVFDGGAGRFGPGAPVPARLPAPARRPITAGP